MTVQTATENRNCPDNDSIRNWVLLALDQKYKQAELTVRIVDEDECADLNRRYRKKTGATNVLSFPYNNGNESMDNLVGDIVICAPVVEQEALEQNKKIQSHWAHIVIHGILHLMGYDHNNDNEAEEMEAVERSIMASLGHADPYQQDET